MKAGGRICLKDYPFHGLLLIWWPIAGRGLTFAEVFGMLPESRTETTT